MRHESWAKELPDRIDIYNGGFSCKSFSKLNTDFDSFRRAVMEQNEDCWLFVFGSICCISYNIVS